MRLSKTLFATLPFLLFTIAITIVNQKNNYQWKKLAKNLIKHNATNATTASSTPLWDALDNGLRAKMNSITAADKDKLELVLQSLQNDSTKLADFISDLDKKLSGPA